MKTTGVCLLVLSVVMGISIPFWLMQAFRRISTTPDPSRTPQTLAGSMRWIMELEILTLLLGATGLVLLILSFLRKC